jgi:glycosyltransferase involved in cell wall biosynthesis
MKKIFISESTAKGVEITTEAIKKAGFEVVDKNYLYHNFFKVKYMSFNWYENINEKHPYRSFIKKVILLFAYKITNKRILWTVQNKCPHDTNHYLSIILMKLLIIFAVKIIILCDETINILEEINLPFVRFRKKVIKIPHPNYIGVYPSLHGYEEEKHLQTDKNNIRFLFLGGIRKYKNIEILIDAVNELNLNNITLTITGICQDEHYKRKLELLRKKNGRIELDLNYVDDDKIVLLIEKHDILVLPYDLKSSLNSGVIFLAFSNKKTVIAPLIGTLKEYSDKSFFYSYEYVTHDEHKNKLKETIIKVMFDVEKDQSILAKKGEVAFKIVEKDNSFSKIIELYKTL